MNMLNSQLLKTLEAEYGSLMWNLKLIQSQVQSCEQRLAEETNRLLKEQVTPISSTPLNGLDYVPPEVMNDNV